MRYICHKYNILRRLEPLYNTLAMFKKWHLFATRGKPSCHVAKITFIFFLTREQRSCRVVQWHFLRNAGEVSVVWPNIHFFCNSQRTSLTCSTNNISFVTRVHISAKWPMGHFFRNTNAAFLLYSHYNIWLKKWREHFSRMAKEIIKKNISQRFDNVAALT